MTYSCLLLANAVHKGVTGKAVELAIEKAIVDVAKEKKAATKKDSEKKGSDKLSKK
jgi:hypothetical protein